jgi:hypothetical protein
VLCTAPFFCRHRRPGYCLSTSHTLAETLPNADFTAGATAKRQKASAQLAGTDDFPRGPFQYMAPVGHRRRSADVKNQPFALDRGPGQQRGIKE